MDATIPFSDLFAEIGPFHKGFPCGTKLSFFIEYNQKSDGRKSLTLREF
jgi:hypothetical protein